MLESNEEPVGEEENKLGGGAEWQEEEVNTKRRRLPSRRQIYDLVLVCHAMAQTSEVCVRK